MFLSTFAVYVQGPDRRIPLPGSPTNDTDLESVSAPSAFGWLTGAESPTDLRPASKKTLTTSLPLSITKWAAPVWVLRQTECLFIVLSGQPVSVWGLYVTLCTTGFNVRKSAWRSKLRKWCGLSSAHLLCHSLATSSHSVMFVLGRFFTGFTPEVERLHRGSDLSEFWRYIIKITFKPPIKAGNTYPWCIYLLK